MYNVKYLICEFNVVLNVIYHSKLINKHYNFQLILV